MINISGDAGRRCTKTHLLLPRPAWTMFFLAECNARWIARTALGNPPPRLPLLNPFRPSPYHVSLSPTISLSLHRFLYRSPFPLTRNPTTSSCSLFHPRLSVTVSNSGERASGGEVKGNEGTDAAGKNEYYYGLLHAKLFVCFRSVATSCRGISKSSFGFRACHGVVDGCPRDDVSNVGSPTDH